MKNLFEVLFGQNFQYLIDLVGQMDTPEKLVFLFWSICVVLFYSTFVYIIYNVVKNFLTNLFTTKFI